ncbi:hypothetical protein F2P81_018810 [Scophthalmus maximus]|uniref:Ninjurin-2-like n=1 Tax=Scophthalmus maximus TaxID=52904 RepID=A0A6A4SBA8_SCOMX|nr:hypothetical protein F2P81_018810 [Scophthalmus maximus]
MSTSVNCAVVMMYGQYYAGLTLFLVINFTLLGSKSQLSEVYEVYLKMPLLSFLDVLTSLPLQCLSLLPAKPKSYMKSKGATESPEGFIVTEEVLLRFKENYRPAKSPHVNEPELAFERFWQMPQGRSKLCMSLRYYAAVLTLISFSLALQIVAGVLIIIIARRDLNVVSNQKRLDYLNNVATGVIFVTTVINFFVSFFGSKRTGFFRWLLARLHF